MKTCHSLLSSVVCVSARRRLAAIASCFQLQMIHFHTRSWHIRKVVNTVSVYFRPKYFYTHRVYQTTVSNSTALNGNRCLSTY